jgi:YD repeat-containing protein
MTDRDCCTSGADRRSAGCRQPALCYDHRMTNPATKILLALLTLAMMTGAASAQQRTFYDSAGNVVGRSSTDSNGTTTNYDSRGRVVSRETTKGNTTTLAISFRRLAESLRPRLTAQGPLTPRR